MPVCSDRDDVIVITDEAHRSQYSALALNMRRALPDAGFLGFTGTPLIKGEEERTREVFGDYVSIYNFRDSIEDGATVPLFYENRIPELQIVNESFDEELTGILEAAELDESQERALSRRFATEYQLITRPERLRRIAADLVRHFVGRGFLGKAMFVSIDKATAVRMYDLVAEEWELYLAELRERATRLPELERIGRRRADRVHGGDRHGRRRLPVPERDRRDARGRPGHRAAPRADVVGGPRTSASRTPTTRFRLVFVCAMWMTGFDVPSCSTIYLDRPMRNHTLMQTIARANRVFPEKENGLIVDYVGVFRHLEAALAVYAAARDGEQGAEIIRDKSALVAELEDEIGELVSFCERWDVDLDALARARGFEFIALRDASVEASWSTTSPGAPISNARCGRAGSSPRSCRPGRHSLTSGLSAWPGISPRRFARWTRAPDLSHVSGAVQDLLDRSVGRRST